MNDDYCDSDVDETKDEKHCFGDGIVEKEATGHLTGSQNRKRWSCFTLGRRATTGKA